MILKADKKHLTVDNFFEDAYTGSTAIEHRRKFAQFFTPHKIANIMVEWVIGGSCKGTVLEPAFGLGIFSRIILNKNPELFVKGFEVDENIYFKAQDIFRGVDRVNIKKDDYMFNDWNNKYDGIICNPPYFKFHDYDNKSVINEIEKRLNVKLSGFTNLYTLFLLKSIYQLNTDGRLAYIVPSEFLNSDYGKLIKTELIKRNILRHIIIFDFEKNVFDDALTTSCILLCSNDNNYKHVKFSNIHKPEQLNNISKYIYNYPFYKVDKLTYPSNELDPEIKWRKYYQPQNGVKYKSLIPFSNVAKVVRGIATGANNYFTFSKSKAINYNISNKYLLPCICKALDVKDNFFTLDRFKELMESDRPCYLFNVVDNKDRNVLEYINIGEDSGIDKKYLTASRNPWYALENRHPSPIWVSVFSRKGLRFIRNEANVSNLTSFHCVYPNESNLFIKLNIDLLFAYLLTETARKIFEDNRREYGNGLKKFEPNDLNNAMMLDLSLLNEYEEEKILNLYHKYRNSVINNSADETFITEIDQILSNKYLYH